MTAEVIRLGEVDVSVRRSARARRLTLTVPRNGDAPRLTAPPRASARELRMFLMRQEDWLTAALSRRPAPLIVAPGAVLPVAGAPLTVTHRPGRRRPPVVEGDALILTGGAVEETGPRIRAWLKTRTATEGGRIVREAAEVMGAPAPTRITARDMKSQWGGCTSGRSISLSWRLAMAPARVLDYVAVHEAAHLREMNHGPRFWALVAAARPDWKRDRDWLRAEGPMLHRARFDAE